MKHAKPGWWLVCLSLLAGFLVQAQAQPLSFVAMGDLPYGTRAQTQAPYEQLINAINQQKPLFTLHVGDIKSGSTRCDDQELAHQKQNFQRFETALIYTPGDNEWTDCHRDNNGAYEPVERLSYLRKLFFAHSNSLGQQPLVLQTQPQLQPEHALWTENRRWQASGVVFATVHVVGSNNNRDPKRAAAMAEFEARDRANVAWIESVFAWAQSSKARAVVLAMQADPFESSTLSQVFPPHSGFTRSLGQTLVPLAHKSGVPVLLIHGDTHRYVFDQPFKIDASVVSNLYRLEVPGGPGDYRAVKVTVHVAQSSQPSSAPQTTPVREPFAVTLIEP